MMHKRTAQAGFGVLVAFATLLAACGPAPTPQVIRETQVVQETVVVPEQVEVVVTATPAPFAPKGTLTIGLTTNVTAIEIGYAPERQSSNAATTMYDSLVYVNDEGEIEPSLAESWEISDDGLEYTFHLRQDVVFHNGEPFNADAVVFSWQNYTQPEVTYASDYLIASSVEKIDDYTVKVVQDAPSALLLERIATSWAMIAPGYHAEVGAEGFAEHPVGTGAFMFEEWVKGDHLTVVANPNYWREGYPKLERIVFKFMPESATRVAALQTGEIDITQRLASEDVKDLLGAPDISIVRYPVNRAYYLAFNNVTTGVGTPIEDPKVRQAIGYAIDLDAIIDALFEGYATRAVGLVAPPDLGFDGADPIPYDPEQAKALLAEAGYPDGFTVDMACPDGAYSHINEVCEAIRSYLNDVGITGELTIMEANAYWELEANKELPPLFVDAWSIQTTEAYPRLQGMLLQEESYANWYEETLAELVKKVGVTADAGERAEIYGEIQQIMRDNPPAVYLYYPDAFEGVRTRVVNYRPRAAEQYVLWAVSVNDAE